MTQILFASVCFALLSSALCNSCTNPEISSTSFTNLDATIVTHIAFIAEFSIKCGNGPVGLNLYADIGENVVPVAKVAENSYQVSWTEDTKVARSGNRPVVLYDDEGYTAYRKALRAGEPTVNVPIVGKIYVSHPGAFQGPWLKSEFMAAALSIVVAYIAFSSRAKLLS